MLLKNRLLLILIMANIFVPITTLLLLEISDGLSIQNYLPVVKDLLIVSIIVLLLFSLRKTKFTRSDYIFIAVIVLSWIISVAISKSSLYGIILNTRRIYLPIIFAYSLYKLKLRRNIVKQLYNFSFYILILGAIFDGLFSEILWDGLLKVERYWQNDTQPGLPLQTFRESSRAYTPDLVFLVGKEFRRLFSILLEPTTFGSIMAYFFAYYLTLKKYSQGYLAAVFGLLAFSKIAMLSILTIPFIGLFRRNKKIFMLIVFFSLIISSFYVASMPILIHGSFSHLIGISSSLSIFLENPLGAGLGMGGNRPGIDLDGIHLGRYGGESGFGNVFYQSPVLGILYLFLFWIAIKRNYSFKILWVFFLNFMLSATSLGLTSIIYPILYFSSYDEKNTA